jgi:hypothetical protein
MRTATKLMEVRTVVNWVVHHGRDEEVEKDWTRNSNALTMDAERVTRGPNIYTGIN